MALVDARRRFAQRAAKTLLDVSKRMKIEGKDPLPELERRAAQWPPEFDKMVHEEVTRQQTRPGGTS